MVLSVFRELLTKIMEFMKINILLGYNYECIVHILQGVPEENFRSIVEEILFR